MSCSSYVHRGNGHKDYQDDADLVIAHLRIEAAKNGQFKNIR